MIFIVFYDLDVRKKWWIICVFSVGLHIALFASSSVWHQFWGRIFIDFRHILTPFWVVLRIKMGMKMKGDFHIDFLQKFDVLLTPFGSIWESLWLPLGTFGRKMEGKERVRFVPKWGPAPKEPRTHLQTSFWRYSGSILRRFWTLWDIPWNAFGRPFWQVFC